MTTIIFLMTIFFGVVGPLCIKASLLNGVSYSDLVFWRSLFAIVLVLPSLFARGSSLKPLFSATAIARMLVGGTVLSLSTFAYRTLTATDVNLLARLDLPIFLILFGVGSKRLAAALVVALGLIYSLMPIHGDSGLGIPAIWIATFLTAVSYWLIRKTAESKNISALVIPPYFGAIVMSVLLSGKVPSVPSVQSLPLLMLASLATVALYVLCAALFLRTRFGAAELTGCIALLCTYAVEGAILNSAPAPATGVAAVLGVLLGLSLIYWEEFPKWIKARRSLPQ